MTNERINRIPKSQQTLLRDSLAIQRSAKPEMRHAISRTLAVLVVAIAGFAHGMTASGGEDEVRLADNGKASAIIVVSAQTMNWGGADRRGIGLYGESEYGTSYAIYELLHRFSCRWFMPSELDRFSGYCTPAKYDITQALQAGDNQFAILCERTYLNELGTGGLMGPVVVYREK